MMTRKLPLSAYASEPRFVTGAYLLPHLLDCSTSSVSLSVSGFVMNAFMSAPAAP